MTDRSGILSLFTIKNQPDQDDFIPFYHQKPLNSTERVYLIAILSFISIIIQKGMIYVD